MKLFTWLKSLFESKEKRANPPFNMHHPDVAHNVEFAFEAGGKKFYRFTEDYKVPVGRWKFLEAYIGEADIRMSLKDLEAYCEELIKELDGKAGQIRISHLLKIVWTIKSRCKLAFSPETIERLAAAVYFDETEDLSGLDMEYVDKKIQLWRKHNSVSFFLTRPISDLFGLKGFSETSFPICLRQIQQAEDLIKNLILDQEKPSLPTTSKEKSTS
jgi:hypothetical protein